MKIERVKTSQLHEQPGNARLHIGRNLDAISRSLQKFGQAQPLIVQASTGMVIGGNGRLAVMRLLGWDEVDVVRLDVDDTTAVVLGLALNRTAETAEWDDDALAVLLRQVGDISVDCGWSQDEIDDLVSQVAEPIPSDDLVARGASGSRMNRNGCAREVVGFGRHIGAVDVDVVRSVDDAMCARFPDREEGCAWACDRILGALRG